MQIANGMMSENGNLISCFSEREMEGEDSVRTVDCLRGRLLAERAASKNAKEEAHQLENKLMELEKLLKQEAKSRNKAEKKLKFLMKKLESINISHASDESEHSGLIDISSISSSTPSSITKDQQQQESKQNHENQESKGKGNLKQIDDSQNCSFGLSDDSSSISSAFEVHLPEFKGLECEMGRDKDVMSPRISKIFEQKDVSFEDSLSSASDHQSEKSSSNVDQQSDFCCRSIRSSADEGIKILEQRSAMFEDSLSSASDHQSEKSSSNVDQKSDFCCRSIRSSADEGIKIVEQGSAIFEDSLSSASDHQSEKSSSNMDQQSDFCCHIIRSSADEGINVEEGHDSDNQVDNSMALVLVNTSQQSHRVDPDALDASVREVLDTLRRAKEQLQSSMERRRMKMIRVGETNLAVKTSTIFI